MNQQERSSVGGVARPEEGLESGISDWMAGNILLMSIAAVLGVLVIMNCVVPMIASRRSSQPAAIPSGVSATSTKSLAGAQP